MKRTRLRGQRKQFVNLFEYILVFLIIAGNYSMIERDYSIGISENILTLLACLDSLILFFVQSVVGNIRKKQVWSLGGAILFSIGMVIVPDSNVFSGMVNWIFPLFCFGLFMQITPNPREIWKKFVNIVFILASVSLVLYIFGSVLQLIQPTRTAVYYYDHADKTCKSYFNLLYEAQKIQGTSWLPNAIYRNCGIFIEAPMFNLILCIAFSAEMAFTTVPRKMVLITLVITIISTFTTTGILFLGIMFVLLIIRSNSKKRQKIIKIFIFPIIVTIFVFIALTVIENKIQSVVGGDSYSVRMDHLMASLKMWINRPLFGYGYGNSRAFYKYTVYDQGFSVGLPVLLGRNGTIVFLIYLIPFIKCLKESFQHNKKELAFFLGTFFLFFMTASIYKTVFLFLIATQLMWRGKMSPSKSQ